MFHFSLSEELFRYSCCFPAGAPSNIINATQRNSSNSHNKQIIIQAHNNYHMKDRIHILVSCLLHLKDVQQEKRSVHAVRKLPEAMHTLATSTWAKSEKVHGLSRKKQESWNLVPHFFGWKYWRNPTFRNNYSKNVSYKESSPKCWIYIAIVAITRSK